MRGACVVALEKERFGTVEALTRARVCDAFVSFLVVRLLTVKSHYSVFV